MNMAHAASRQVPCPACGEPSVFAPDNRWRPFCSGRCAGLDLGAWANEGYRVAAPPSSADEGGDTPAPPH
ncbi:MAG: DNA gyrase inhibitor YacG [Burkholderiaceae bacterium]|nr:DNA gyrase inhibitor YacG [Burkholderiaceae bacterium]